MTPGPGLRLIVRGDEVRDGDFIIACSSNGAKWSYWGAKYASQRGYTERENICDPNYQVIRTKRGFGLRSDYDAAGNSCDYRMNSRDTPLDEQDSRGEGNRFQFIIWRPSGEPESNEYGEVSP